MTFIQHKLCFSSPLPLQCYLNNWLLKNIPDSVDLGSSGYWWVETKVGRSGVIAEVGDVPEGYIKKFEEIGEAVKNFEGGVQLVLTVVGMTKNNEEDG